MSAQGEAEDPNIFDPEEARANYEWSITKVGDKINQIYQEQTNAKVTMITIYWNEYQPSNQDGCTAITVISIAIKAEHREVPEIKFRL